MGPGSGPEALLGQTVAGYQLDELSGLGATGAVFLASRLPDSPRMVEKTGQIARELPDIAAIKILLAPWALGKDERADFQARFLREAQTLNRLEHPNILSVIDYGQDVATGHTYMILPYMAGGTLAQAITAEGKLPLDRIDSIITQIASALDYAHHEEQVIHRDIKPGNILLDAEGKPYLADFSIVRLLSETQTKLTTTGRVMGTPAYMAPEQIAGTRDISPRTDIYGLAMVTYEMVTGKVAFDATTLIELIKQQMDDTPPSPRDARPDLPEPAAAVIMKALAKAPEDRFESAGAFAAAFTDGLQGRWTPGVTVFAFGAAKALPSAQPIHNPAVNPPTPLYQNAPSRRHGLGAISVIVTAIVLISVASGLVLGQTSGMSGGLLGLIFPSHATSTVAATSAVTATAEGGISIPSATASPDPTAIAAATVTVGSNTNPQPPVPPPPTATAVPPPPTATAVPPPPTIDIHMNIGYVQTSDATVQTAVSCGTGEVMVGGGADAEGILFSDYPIGSTTWVAEGSGTYVGQRVFVYVVCVSQPGALTTLIESSSSVNIAGGGDARVSCPSGWMLVGGGFRVIPGPSPLFGNGGAFNLVITGSTPGGDIWDSYAVGQTGEQLQTYAICAQNVFTSTYILTATANANPGAGANITRSCNGSDLLTSGGGADITMTSAQSMSLDGSFPSTDGSTWHYTPVDFEDTQVHGGEIFIICASL